MVSARDDLEARLIALQMVGCRPECQMCTSSTITEVVL